MPSLGTRQQQNFNQGRPPTEDFNGTDWRDYGKSTRAVATLTFTAPDTILAGAAIFIPPVKVGDRLLITGTNLNDGLHQIKTIAGGNLSITVDQGVKAEGPITCKIGTP